MPAPRPLATVKVPPRVDLWASAPAAVQKVLAAVDALAAKGQWKSAWDTLSSADAAGNDPWLLAKSIALALDGHADTKEHLAFTFVDLASGMTLETARTGAKGEGAVPFDPVALAEAQNAAKIAPVPALEFELGRYLGEVASLYPGAWRMPDDEILARETDARAAARAAGAYDAASLQAEAELAINRGDAPDAEVLAVAAEGLGNPIARLRYDHAIALFMQERYEDGLALIDAGLATDPDKDSRVSGLSLAAQGAALAGKDDRVEAYLSLAEKESPDSPRPYLYRHLIFVSRGDQEKANAAADLALTRFGPDPQVISSLVKTWFDSGDPAACLPFLDRGLAAYASNDAAMTIFGIYKAMIVLKTANGPGDLKDVGPLLDATEEHAKKGFPGKAEIQNAIDSLRSGLAQLSAVPPPPASEAPSAAPAPAATATPVPAATSTPSTTGGAGN
ncbi:MAG TPA: hypothetical protein VMV44_07760 [Rectinemataceae bacterium]|nr:hypothetical protein [Rectinemataceae bacterium]